MAAPQALAFGELLKRYRVAAGLTQAQLAERAGLSERAISDLERGARRVPQRATLQLLAEALGLVGAEQTALQATVVRTRPPTLASTGPILNHGLLPHATAVLPPLVGRTRELALLAEHLAGERPALLLAGEPGIGKSRLLAEAATRAPGWTVLAGGCQRRGGQEPFAPLLGALQGYLQSCAPAQLRAVLHDCAWLVRLLPELLQVVHAPLPAWTLSPEQERRLMFAAVGRFLAHVAGPAGTLLVLDDLQWAGADALELLASLLPAPARPLRVLGAYRSTEVDPQSPLAVALADLAHAGLATHLTLGPLAPADGECLLDVLLREVGPVDARLRAQLLQRAGGVPFFAVSCVRALRPGTQEADALPWDLRHSIRQRAAMLAGEAQEVLGAAAVIGRRVAPGLLTAVAARPEEAVLAALEAATRAQLLVEEADAAAYQFAHDVIREVIEADVGGPRRTLLHRRVGEALEEEPGACPVERLAYHFTCARAPEKAVLYLERAGDRALAQHAYATAEGYYRELLAHVDGLGRAQQAAAVREKLHAVLYPVAQVDATLAQLERAAETYRLLGDVEGQARATAHIGTVHALRATPEEGVARVQACLATLGDRDPSAGQAALYAALASLFLATCRGAERESVAAAERAAELARAVGNDTILIDAEVRRSAALFYLGRTQEAQQVLEDALPRAEAAGLLNAVFWALSKLGTIHLYAGAFARSWEYHARALALAERVGDQLELMFALSRRSEVLVLQGEWQAARRDLERAVDLGRTSNDLSMLLRRTLLLRLARLHLVEGEWSAAARYAEEWLPWAERTGDLPDIHSLLAERELLQGRPDAALARLTPLLDHPGTAAIERTPLLPLVAWAHLERGEDVAAAETVARGIEHARAQHHRLALVDALRVQAMVAIRQGCWATAEQALEEGLALARGMPYPYAEARLLHVSGGLHAQKGEPEPARERLEEALAIFRRLGARKDVERVEQATAELLLSILDTVASTVITAGIRHSKGSLPPPPPRGEQRRA